MNAISSDSSGDVSIGIKCAPGVVGSAEADINFDIIKNDNDTFTVKYTPPGPGRYTIMVLFADQVSVSVSEVLYNSSDSKLIYSDCKILPDLQKLYICC